MGTSGIRLQKFIASCGVTSRRKAEELIILGKVTINGVVVKALGTKINPQEDVVCVKNNPLDPQAISKVYLVMHKPRGYVTTLDDPEGRPTVMDLCQEVSERVYPVGRLDYLSEGLLILTNDGDLANKIMHPRFQVNKVYEVKVYGAVTLEILKKLRAGGKLEDGSIVVPKSVRVIQQLPTKTWLEFRLAEGRNREIRQLCEACGVSVDKLKRVAIEGLTIQDLAPGKYRFYTKKALLRALGINEQGEKVQVAQDYRSLKKSINIAKKGPQVSLQADHKLFQKFRKDKYYDFLQGMEELKKKSPSTSS